MENEISAYMAGFFDGEGCITISKRERKEWNTEYTVRISIGQKDGMTMDWIVEKFGGKIHRVKRDGSFMWYATNRVALNVLQKIIQFMKYKKPQALLAIQFYENINLKRPIPEDELKRREEIFLKLKSLKKEFTESNYSNVRRFND